MEVSVQYGTTMKMTGSVSYWIIELTLDLEYTLIVYYPVCQYHQDDEINNWPNR